jgi:PKD repeat protein
MSRYQFLLLLVALLCAWPASGASADVAAQAVPVVSFTADVTTGVAPLTVHFTDQSTESPTSWSWDFGDESASTAQNPAHVYTAEGSYTVVLAATNASGTAMLVQENYITVTAQEGAAPVASFTRDPATGDAPLTVQFTDTSTNTPTAWAWSFGDGGSSSEQNPSHEYTGDGVYTVVLAASNAVGTGTKVWTDCVTVTTALPPVPNFSGAPRSGEAPLAVSFTDLSSNGPTSWQWDFGDGATSPEQNPTHTYTESGSYTVALTATNAAGSASEEKTGYIVVGAPGGQADFTAVPTSGPPPLTVQFTDTSTNNATIWAWNFGDGSYSHEQHPQHTYTAAGSYTVTLTSWGDGEPQTETKVGLITVATPVAANFGADPLRGPAPLLVRFTDLSTNGPTSWDWDFGDGATSTARNPEHEFAAPGQYEVKLTATNAAGPATARRIVTATQTDGANFSGAPASGTVPLTVHFTDLSAGEPVMWGWQFGDGATDVARNPEHRYSAPGRYAVSLTTLSGAGVSTLTRERYILATFRDVPLEHWALNEILSCVGAGAVVGYPDGTYRPEEVVTRAPMAVYLARALAGGEVPEGPPTPSFSDVPRGHWAYRYVEYAVAHDMVRGYPDGYHPDEPVNRAQMAVYMARAAAGGEAAVPDYSGAPSFSDVTSGNAWAWSLKYVEYARTRGIINGYSGGVYHPEYEVTRDQMAVYLARAFGLQ